jgi:hypothetical protein
VCVARDGREFHSITSAVHHNEDLDHAEAATAILHGGGTVYDAALAAGRTKPADILRSITTATPLVISHWQCRDTPGYTVARFDSPYTLFVGGDAGSWSGPYGAEVTLEELARYAEDTIRRYPEIAARSAAPTDGV